MKSARVLGRFAISALSLAVLAGCKSKRAPAPSASPEAPSSAVERRDAAPLGIELGDAGLQTDGAADGGDASPAASSSAAEAHAMSVSGSTTIVLGDAGAGAGACKLLRPALMQATGGPAVIHFVHAGSAQIAQLVFNEGGRPAFSDAPLLVAKGAPRDVPMPPKTTLLGCAAARDVVYCADALGVIHRTRGHGDDDTIVARSRAGTPIAAAPIGDRHVLLVYIEEHTTSEGLVREAEVRLDDGPPVRLSEDGSGATSIDLAPRGDEVLALSVDARVAMTPTHVRTLRVRDGKLDLGKDAVVFVGGPGERHSGGVLAVSKEGAAFALVAASDSVESFGMAAVRLSDPPKEDEPTVWSKYPNGLDPAPLAASRGISPIAVARVRPSAALSDASRVLELGRLEPSGEFRARCILSEAAYIKDLALEIDREGAMWIFWRDTRGSHFERRALP